MSIATSNARIYREETDVGNGDPFVACAMHDGEPTTTHLGTGFESFHHMQAHIDHAVETGESTAHITSETASDLEGADEVRVYELAMTVEDAG